MDAKMIMQDDFSFKEGQEYIKVNFKEVYEVEPGYKLFDIYLFDWCSTDFGVVRRWLCDIYIYEALSLDFRVEARREKRDRVVKKESCYEVKKENQRK